MSGWLQISMCGALVGSANRWMGGNLGWYWAGLWACAPKIEEASGLQTTAKGISGMHRLIIEEGRKETKALFI